jgi:hypothetical protein
MLQAEKLEAWPAEIQIKNIIKSNLCDIVNLHYAISIITGSAV